MNMAVQQASPISFDAALATFDLQERDLAFGVTKWMHQNFAIAMSSLADQNPQFSVPLLCAIACREAGAYWLPLTKTHTAAEILTICVYDASGDVPGTSRSAFPVDTAAFRAAYGDAFTELLISETNKARAVRGLSPNTIVYKGYGIFQYDLQNVQTDRAFFEQKLWYNFDECLKRVIAELNEKLRATGDLNSAVVAYNGSGPKAEQYAVDVFRIMTFCEQALSSPHTSATDPASPAEGEIFNLTPIAAVNLANFGGEDEDAVSQPRLLGSAEAPQLQIDIQLALQFLKECEDAKVGYGLGAKVPSLTAVPGRDFSAVDCSGFVRATIQRSTSPTAAFPDGSVTQHDFVAKHGFEVGSVEDGKLKDSAIRIAFLRPQDTKDKIGHVVLIFDGNTLESHGGVGPSSRLWDGLLWQAKTSVYVLRQPQAAVAPTATLMAADRPAGRTAMSFNQGQPPTIACINTAETPLGVDWHALVSALDEYANKIYAPVWGTPCKIVDAGAGPIPPGTWGLLFIDDADTANALGYHDLTPEGLPLSKVFVRTTLQAGDKVSVTASHELAEMLVDPGIQIGALGPDNTTWYAYETADAVEREEFTIQNISMSNFVYPSWFEGFRAPKSGKFDHLGSCSKPFELRPGGYISTYANGSWGQVFGSQQAQAKYLAEIHPRATSRGRPMKYTSSR